MDTIAKGYRVLRQDGVVAFVRRSAGFLVTRLIRAITGRMPPRLYQLLTPDCATLRIGELAARFDLSFVTQERDFRHDFYAEREVIASFVSDLRDGDVVYDIGANVGLYSAFAGRRLGDSGTVVAVEPNPVPIRHLYDNLAMNCRQYRVVNVAAGGESGWAKIAPSFRTDVDISSDQGVTVKVEPMNVLTKEPDVPNPTAVKVDVEGAELAVLEGFGALLSSVRVLYVEVHHMRGTAFGSSEDRILAHLKGSFERIEKLARHDRGGGTQTHYRATSAQAV